MLKVKRKPAAGNPARPRRTLKLMSIQGAADYTALSTQTIRRAIKAGELNHYRAGRQLRVDEDDLVDWLSPRELRWL